MQTFLNDPHTYPAEDQGISIQDRSLNVCKHFNKERIVKGPLKVIAT